jgi:hypothetical protein
MQQAAYRFETSVGPNGKVELNVPVPQGTKIEVFVLTPGPDDFSDLVAAASSSLGFWNNATDDEDWNNDLGKETSF